MKSKSKKKAFTLTELLVVVIVIGILSAVVLPKFSKVIETRKTTEAEEMMAAVRTEQEKRCALDKNYTTDAATVNLASLTSKNYTYTLKNTGIEAASTGKYNYTLKMPSYRDGRLCCDNEEQCSKLNKNYPLCAELTAKADYTSGAECAADTETPTPNPIPCSGSATQACGCKNGGTQTRTCDTTTGTWSAWSACSIAETCSCDEKTKPTTTETCNSCGTRTRTVTCDSTTGEWKKGSWGTCSKQTYQCGGGSGGSSGGSPQAASFLVFSDKYGAYYSGDSALCGCGCDITSIGGTSVSAYCPTQREAESICAQGGTGCITSSIPSVASQTVTTPSEMKCIGSMNCVYTGSLGSMTGSFSGWGGECNCSGHMCTSDNYDSIRCSGVSSGTCVDSSCQPITCSWGSGYKCTESVGSSKTCTVPGVTSISGYICSNYAKGSSDVCGSSGYGGYGGYGGSCGGGYGGYGGY